MKKYSIEKGELYTDLDCLWNPENNKIDVYSSVYWSAENEDQYDKKQELIESYTYCDNLMQVKCWCDISGYKYWILDQEDDNYVSIDIYLVKDVKEYTQQEIFKISEKIKEIDDYFRLKLIEE